MRHLIVGVITSMIAVGSPMSAQADLIPKSSSWIRTFLLVQSADHVTGLTGATVTCQISKNGGSGAGTTNSVSQVDSTNLPGVYKVTLTSTETNTAGPLDLNCTATSADPTTTHDVVYDPAAASFGVNLVQVDGAALTSHASGKVPTDVLTVAGTAQTARDLGASVLLDPGTGTGQVDLSGGKVKVQPGTSAGQLDCSSGVCNVSVAKWLGSTPAALTTSGYLQAMVLRWLTDDAGGTPSALISGRVDSDPWNVTEGSPSAGTYGYRIKTDLDYQFSKARQDLLNAIQNR